MLLAKYEEAIGCFNKALEALSIFSGKVEAWHNKGATLGDLGRHEEAIVCYDEALANDRSFALAWNNKGNALCALGKYEEAIVCYDKALAIDPENIGARWDLGRSEWQRLSTSHHFDPQGAIPWRNKGNALRHLGRHEEAIVCYDKALAIDPRDAMAWSGKAFAEEATGKPSAAVRSYRRFIALAPAQSAEQIAYACQRLKELQSD